MSSLRQKVRKSLDICLYSYEDPDAPLKEMTDQGEGAVKFPLLFSLMQFQCFSRLLLSDRHDL